MNPNLLLVATAIGSVSAVVLAVIWIEVDRWVAARRLKVNPEPKSPGWVRTVFYLLVTLALMVALGLLVNLLRLVHTPVGWLGAHLEHLLRRLAASGDRFESKDEVVILDDHGHPYDPENTPWNDNWSTK